MVSREVVECSALGVHSGTFLGDGSDDRGPAGGEFGGWGWWVIGAFGVLFVLSIFFSFLDGWKMRKHSYEEQVEVFLEDLRSGAVTRRGHIDLDPLKYTKLTDKDADRIAEEVGYYRQTFGTQGQWLFFRPVDSGDERK